MHPLEHEIQTINEQCLLGNLTNDEKNYLIQEIRDIRAADECAGDEVMFRHVVQACNIAMGLM
jgi:hypothetical protein